MPTTEYDRPTRMMTAYRPTPPRMDALNEMRNGLQVSSAGLSNAGECCENRLPPRKRPHSLERAMREVKAPTRCAQTTPGPFSTNGARERLREMREDPRIRGGRGAAIFNGANRGSKEMGERRLKASDIEAVKIPTSGLASLHAQCSALPDTPRALALWAVGSGACHA